MTSPTTTRGSIVSEPRRSSSTSSSSTGKKSAADLLPPGADAEPVPAVADATRARTAQAVAPTLPTPPVSVPPLPVAVVEKAVRVGRTKTPEERALFRFWKNLIVFAVLVVVLLVVFWAMAR